MEEMTVQVDWQQRPPVNGSFSPVAKGIGERGGWKGGFRLYRGLSSLD